MLNTDTGRLSWLRPCWQSGQVVPVLAQPTALELLQVLAHPKFRLQLEDRDRLLEDRDRLLEDLLPWCESWSGSIPSRAASVRA